MQVTRNNYEEFFILYLDNELDPAQRQEVEAFVQLHPDLREELDLLSQFRVSPDEDIVFPSKSTLLRGETGSHGLVNADNYESYLLSYIDDELTTVETDSVREFVSQNAIAARELQELEAAKLSPEAIIFPDKDSLYRHEKRRTIPLFVRVGIAAAVAGIAIVSVLRLTKPHTGPETLAKTGTPVKTSPIKVNQTTDRQGNQQNIIAVPDDQKNKAAVASVREEKPTTITPAQKDQKDRAIPTTDNNVKEEERLATNNTNNLAVPVIEPRIEKVEAPSLIADNVHPLKTDLTKPAVTSETLHSSDLLNASYVSNDKNFGDDASDGKKSKLRGFFRKVTRTFQKRTNIDPTDDDKLLVGGLSFNLK